MFYLIAIPVGLLLYYSLYQLGQKHLGKEPAWMKYYAILVLIYIELIPILLTVDLSKVFDLSSHTTVLIGCVVAIAILLLALRFFPKQVTENS